MIPIAIAIGNEKVHGNNIITKNDGNASSYTCTYAYMHACMRKIDNSTIVMMHAYDMGIPLYPS